MEPIIITAFWDVGRGDNCLIPRSNEKYYKEFAEWARIRNRMIVYTDQKSKDTIYSIRESYGLEDRTQIIVQENIFDVEPELYSKMSGIEVLDAQMKYIPNAMSNRANFDYAWLMKYWCISDAAQYVEPNSMLAWVDFGFNHMDKCYTNMEEFDFLWDCTASDDKIHIFSLEEIHRYDNENLIGNILFQNDVMMGVFHLVPQKYAFELWQLIRQAMVSLIQIRVLDDDQMLLLMAYYSKPEIFEVHKSNWFLPLKEMGAKHLTVRQCQRNKITGNIIFYIKKKTYQFNLRAKFISRVIKKMNEYGIND